MPATLTTTLSISGAQAGDAVEYSIQTPDGVIYSAFTATGVVDQGGGVFSVDAVLPTDQDTVIVWHDITSGQYSTESLPRGFLVLLEPGDTVIVPSSGDTLVTVTATGSH